MVIPFLVLIGKQLKRVPILGKLIDERFLNHRLRAQRVAGLTGFLLADALLIYRHALNHAWNLDLFAIVVTVAAVYFVMIAYYLFTE